MFESTRHCLSLPILVFTTRRFRNALLKVTGSLAMIYWALPFYTQFL